ncbi:MAG: threonine-phosphate decarboxylase CobD [Dongiaceae bacterium]
MTGTNNSPLAEVTDHGGSLSRAERLFPDAPKPWLDLSTGINPHSYPVANLPASAFTRLPEGSRLTELAVAAAHAYRAPGPANVVAAPGTQILLPLVSALIAKKRAAILSPTYAEHRRAAALAGHETADVSTLDELAASNLAILVNPNNPDGRICTRVDLLDLAARMKAKGGLLVVDEAFMDVGPAEESLAPDAEAGGFVVLRSFGKFFGLAGVRLGFAIGSTAQMAGLRARLGPWAVSGPALELGIAALGALDWQQAMRDQLIKEADRLDRLLMQNGLTVAGGTSLYRFVRTPAASSVFAALGRQGIIVRAFDEDPTVLRFGLPGSDENFTRLGDALGRCHAAKK